MALINIERQHRRSRAIPLTPLVDVVCNLLIFFMLSTTFVRTESMELSLPSSEKSAVVAADASATYIYVSNNGETFLGNKSVDISSLPDLLVDEMHGKADARIMVLVANQVSVQTLVTVMDEVYRAGGRNVSVADWKMPVGGRG